MVSGTANWYTKFRHPSKWVSLITAYEVKIPSPGKI